MKRLLVVALGLVVLGLAEAKPKFEDADKARIDNGYAKVLFKDGHKAVFPLKTLTDDEQALIQEIATRAPLPAGNAKVETYVPTKKRRVTIVKQEKKGTVETVELNTPSSIRDQGQVPTCQFHALAHALDIAGYFYDVDRLIDYAKVPETTDAQQEALRKLYGGKFGYGTTATLESGAAAAAARLCPQAEYHYVSWAQITRQMQQAALARANPANKAKAYYSVIIQSENWKWVREEIRQGRPVMGALINDYWRILPAEYFETHRAPDMSIGHAIVIHGFTWDETKQTGTFLLINSWEVSPQITVSTVNAKEVLYGCFSIEPKST